MSDWQSIPGETPIDPSGLKIGGVTNPAQLSRVEAPNVRKAIMKYLASRPSQKLAPFDLDWCQRLHAEMLGDVWQWAGEIRKRDLNIGKPFGFIRENLLVLLEDLHVWPGLGMDFIEQAMRLHHRAVQIHPFENGNGRWSRLLANIWLCLNDRSIVAWPEATIGATSVIRDEYIAAIKEADQGDLEPLITMHRRYVEAIDKHDALRRSRPWGAIAAPAASLNANYAAKCAQRSEFLLSKQTPIVSG